MNVPASCRYSLLGIQKVTAPSLPSRSMDSSEEGARVTNSDLQLLDRPSPNSLLRTLPVFIEEALTLKCWNALRLKLRGVLLSLGAFTLISIRTMCHN